jgi:hypothetical protein
VTEIEKDREDFKERAKRKREERERREKGIKWGERKLRMCRILCGSGFVTVGVTSKISTNF